MQLSSGRILCVMLCTILSGGGERSAAQAEELFASDPANLPEYISSSQAGNPEC